VLASLGIAGASFSRAEPAACPYLRPGYAAAVGSGQRLLGWLGEVHPDVRRRFGLKPSVFFGELDLAALESLWPERQAGIQLPKFPAVTRDLTLIVEQGLEAGTILASLSGAAHAWLEAVQLVAVYDGPPVPPGHKSVSLRMTYRSPDQTLADEQVNDAHRGLSERLLEQYRAFLPG
jgi:phenylalanyl-tRNA synthetase beta chain